MTTQNQSTSTSAVNDTTELSNTKNNFVFKDNQEFVNFQMQFVDIVRADGGPLDLGTDCGCADEVPKFYSSKDCEQIKLTFMYQDAPYTIINNKAFFWEGYKNVVIQGARSRRTNKHDIPTIEIYNECAKDAQKYKIPEKDNEYFHSYANDDAIFNIQNEHNAPADIVISDIAFRVAFKLDDVINPLGESIKADAAGGVEGSAVPQKAIGGTDVADVVKKGYLYEQWYNPDICPVFFKVYEASSFKMFNVRMYSQYLDLTHLFLHWCENVDITNCEFKNYNARKIGGNIWLCQRVKNVNIVNNDFYKYGNDENIGIYSYDEVCLDDDYYEAKSEYEEVH